MGDAVKKVRDLPGMLEQCVDIYDTAMKEYAIVGTKDGEECTVFRVPKQSGMVRAYVVADGVTAETLVRRLVLEEVVNHVLDL